MESTGDECFASAIWELGAQNRDKDTEVWDKYGHERAGLDEATQGKE